MGFFDLFKPNNQDTLSRDEKEAAKILKDIFHGYQNGDPNYIPNGVEKLAIGLYYLAFKRTNKKVFRLEDALNPMTMLNGNFKGVHYVGVYSAIKTTIEKTCNNPVMLRAVITIQECEQAILVVLKTSATSISKI